MLFLRSRSRQCPRRAAGFTILELIMVMTVILIMSSLVISNFKGQMIKVRLVGDATAIKNSLQRARAGALRQTKMVVGEIDSATNELRFFYNEEQDPEELDFSAGLDELVFPALVLSEGRVPGATVHFWSVGDASPNTANAVADFTPRPGNTSVVVFESTGKVRDLGGFRIGMGIDPVADSKSGNWMEIRVATQASGRVEIRKFIPGHVTPYQVKFQTPSGPNWQFYE